MTGPQQRSLYLRLLQLDRTLNRQAQTLWEQVDLSAVQASVMQVVAPLLMPLATQTQVFAVEAAQDQLNDWATVAEPLDATAFAGYTPSGQPLTQIVVGAAISTMLAQQRGEPARRAMQAGAVTLERDVTSLVHDTARQSLQVGIVADRRWTSWVRQVEPGACSRCIILAGRVYRWSEGFQRHPRCRCHHVPSTVESNAAVASPQELFDNLSRDEQDRIFTEAGAAAIRDGADMAQIVNARRGMTTVTVGGRSIRATTEGTTRRGYFTAVRRRIDAERGATTEFVRGTTSRYRRIATPRLLPEQIYRLAGGNRAEAIRLLHSNGYYVLGPSERAAVAPSVGRARSEQAPSAPKSAGGGGGGNPPTPPNRFAPGSPEDGEWEARQQALGIDTHGERLEPHEIEFVERFQARGQHLRWIPTRADGKRFGISTNDFLWVEENVEVELKSITTPVPSYRGIKRRIQDAVQRAAAHGVVKNSFIIDLGPKQLREQLRLQLSLYNVRNPAGRIERLWVMSDSGRTLTKIDLQT